MKSPRTEESIRKRWNYIKQETIKFCSAVEHVENNPLSGIGVISVAATVIYPNLTKEVIEVQRMDVKAKKANAMAKLRDAEARRMDAEAKTRAEDTRNILTNVSNMDDDTWAWFIKKHAKIRARGA
ncbi:hypothetical protein QYE76_007804 [Lolium multiflorum]|uniref:Uncharacterized protein n=1 Tax=Lolium multiflorum TaxID=4521 RepID=A0AAD8V8Y0_LOLMU|nr:hypothetical protein QYE76_007804 [Lolium multiflorum]